MPTSTATTGIVLPVNVSNDIWQKVQKQSAVMQLAQQVQLLPGGTEFNIITGDPTASWVGEGEAATVSDGSYAHKKMKGYKMNVIVPFTNEFRDNLPVLYDNIVARVPMAMAQKFDATVFGGAAKPGELFDNLAGATAYDLETDAWAALVGADEHISDADGLTNGWVFSPKGKSMLLQAKDANKRPLFVANASESGPGIILGAPTYFEKGVYQAATTTEKAVYGFAGDWTNSVYGIVNDFSVSISDQATLKLSSSEELNLWQNGMFAVKVEFTAGFRIKFDDVFAKLVGAAVATA